jgi:hypothetical protein
VRFGAGRVCQEPWFSTFWLDQKIPTFDPLPAQQFDEFLQFGAMWPDWAFAEFITEIEASWVDGVHVFFPKRLVRESGSLDWTNF